MDALQLLTKQYTQPHRRFHTLEHIAYMFRKANEHDISLNRAQTLAIWWHDAIYVPGAADNEEKSCRLAHDYFNHLQDVDFINIMIMIQDTKTHIPRTAESAIVCDLDMMILADTKIAYRRYAKQVRQEFNMVPDDQYRQGRIQFLGELMLTPIYHSDVFKKYRERAISNITEEIKSLKRK